MPTYSDTLEYLDSFINYERTGMDFAGCRFDLDKLRDVLKDLGDPHRDYRSVHVTGTKGKGSVCSFTSSILEEAGYRTGLYTSPHLATPRERIKVNGKLISKGDFADVLGRLRKYLDSPGHFGEFTFFEICTLMAMLYFSMRKVDYAVFEVGMGGRFDATNVLDAEVSGIGPISYDHTHVLGNTIEKIAKEKAEIIKRGARCVSSPQRDRALSVIRDKCREENASFSLVGKDINFKVTRLDENGTSFDILGKRKRYENCRSSLAGEFQASNCATAVGICEELFAEGGGIDEETVKRGIERASIPGRLEVLSRKPLLVIDGAQNEESASRLKGSIEKIFRYDKLVLILGFSKDKDIKGVCGQLVPAADEIVLTKASVARAADPLLVRGYVKNKEVKITNDVKEALGRAFKLAGKGDMILAAGSFFVIGEIRKLLVGAERE